MDKKVHKNFDFEEIFFLSLGLVLLSRFELCVLVLSRSENQVSARLGILVSVSARLGKSNRDKPL
jgi:hypothetical protein